MQLIFNMVWPWFFCLTVFVCPQSPYRGNDKIFWNFLLSFVTHFACDIGQSAKIFRFEFHLRSSPSTFCGYGRAVDLITSLLAKPCWPYQARSKQRLTSVTRHESSEIKQITVKDNWTSANVQFSGSVTSGPTEVPNTEKEKIPRPYVTPWLKAPGWPGTNRKRNCLDRLSPEILLYKAYVLIHRLHWTKYWEVTTDAFSVDGRRSSWGGRRS